MSHRSPIPVPKTHQSPIVDSFEERKVTELLTAQNKPEQLVREPDLLRARSFESQVFRDVDAWGLICAEIAES
jgi:hypothetical protein